VSTDGLLPLAQSFDTVGWLTRDAHLLATVGDVLLPASPVRPFAEVLVVPELVALAQPDVALAVEAQIDEWDASVRESWVLPDLSAWLAAFQTLQAWEAWRSHGGWLQARLDTLGADVRGRFEAASRVGDDDAARAAEQVTAARTRIRGLLGDRVLVLPSSSSVAPRIGEGLQEVRRRHDEADLSRRHRRLARGQHPDRDGRRPAVWRLRARPSWARQRSPAIRSGSRLSLEVHATCLASHGRTALASWSASSM